jgi:PadR family transcriptional regulator PadR
LFYKIYYFILLLYLALQDKKNGGKDMSQTQMLKGILDGCLLAIINGQECYGYEMAERLSGYGFGTISEGTIYPLLLRMQREGLVTSVRRESIAGPKRKYYSLTHKGQQALIDFLTRWDQLQKSVNSVIQKEMED